MKKERKPETKYSNHYKTLYITDSEEESSNNESTTPEYSWDNLVSRKKRKSKQIKTNKNNTSEKLHQDKNDNHKRYRKQLLLLLITKLDYRKTQYQDKR